MKKKIWNYVIGIIFIIGGIFLLFNPNEGISSIVKYVGALLLVVGLVKVLYSLLDKVYLKDENMTSGILNIVFGLILFLNSSGTIKFISILIGIWLILSSIPSLILLLNANDKNIVERKALINSIVKLVLGIIILITPVITWIFTGIVMGFILIIIGVYIIFTYKDTNKVYKVKVKK